MINLILPCSGLGYINRGYESFTRELYETLVDVNNMNVTLYQGRGEVLNGAKAIWAPKRTSNYDKYLPWDVSKHQKSMFEELMFSFPILYSALKQEKPIIHFSEALPVKLSYHLRRRFGGSFHLLFSNGGPRSPKHFMRYDYVQVLTPLQKKQAIMAGYPEQNLFLIPYGLKCNKFYKANKNSASDWGLPDNRKIILSVGALNTSHKRMDWVINEFSALDQSKYYLWMVGQEDGVETVDLKLLAKNKLDKGSYKFTTTSYEKMPSIYKTADVFVLCSLREGFGRVYLEAMASGLPVLAHKTENTEWILGKKNDGLLDMTEENLLAQKINSICSNNNLYKELKHNNIKRVLEKFDWTSLKPQYIEMYESITKKPPIKR